MSRQKAKESTHESYASLKVALAAVVVVVVLWAAWAGGMALAGDGTPITKNPFAAMILLVFGKTYWPGVSWLLLVLEVAVIAGVVVAWMTTRTVRPAGELEIEKKAQFMTSAKETSGMLATDVQQNTQRLFRNADMDRERDWGLRVAALVDRKKTPIYASWEQVLTIVGGPRSGKTAAFAIPWVCACPGAALVTSNKRDIHDATRGIRETSGTVWLSDLQHITGLGGQDWWWNPLRGMTSLKEAQKMAAYFVSASREESSKVDSYFDGGAQDVLALHMLAAAVSGGDMQHVYGWLSDPELTLPEELLRKHPAAGLRIRTLRGLNARQRDGLYDMARRFLAVMADPDYAASILPPVRKDYGPEDSMLGRIEVEGKNPVAPEFIAEDFVASSDTLYALSMEGPDAATALTTALVGTVLDAAVRHARRSGGRLPTPMLAILDEAANVCRLKELPGWYSHFGSQGIVLATFLQSIDQAARVWGPDGVKELINASNVHIYGGGGRDVSSGTNYLSNLSTLIGQHDVSRWSRSTGRGEGFFDTGHKQQQWSQEPIFTVDELAALPGKFAIGMFSGNYPVLLRKEFSNDGPFADQIAASIAVYGEASETLTPAQRSVEVEKGITL